MSVSFVAGLLHENNKEKSMVFSPLALGAALAGVHYGSDGWTQSQLNRVLLPGRGSPEVSNRYHGLVNGVSEISPFITTKMLNKMLIKQATTVNGPWSANVLRLFRMETEQCAFEQVDEIVRSLNTACREKTDGRIFDVVKEFNFDFYRDIQAFLVQAAYFKGLWHQQFKEARPGDFRGPMGSRKELFVSGRRGNVIVQFWEDVDAVGIPFKDHSYRLWIVLPHRNYTLKGWINDHLDPSLLSSLVEGGYEERCFVRFPCFRVESHIPVKRNLNRMGLNQVFTDRAELGEISDPSIFITDIVHKSVIEIGGDGVEPAPTMMRPSPSLQSVASTSTTRSSRATSIQFSNPGPSLPELKADRPFLYLITHQRNILFCGTYY